MAIIDRSIFTSDLRYLLHSSVGHSRFVGSGHTHWLASLVVAVAVAAWVGSQSPFASINPTALDFGPQSISAKAGHTPASAPNTQDLDQSLARMFFSEGDTAESATQDWPATRTRTPFPVDSAHAPEVSFRLSLAPGRVAPTPAEDTPNWTQVKIRPGDTLSAIFRSQGFDPRTAIWLANQEEGQALGRLRAGKHLEFRTDAGDWLELRYPLGTTKTLIAKKHGGEIQFSVFERAFDYREVERSSVIRSSLFQAASDAGLSEGFVYALADLFRWQIDFTRDLRFGDSFSVVYEEKYLDDERVGYGPILAAEFILSDKRYRAIRHVDAKGNAAYYSPEGEPLRAPFLRSPVRFSRISSGFSNRRYHPVLKKWRSHKGVDYAARPGTPVVSTADGTVKFVGRRGGYGKTVIVRHHDGYETLYAHLKGYRKALKKGLKVRQGQTIGYVGSSGLATGPHLHYEFLVNGKHRDPLKIKVAKAKALGKSEKARFDAQTKTLVERLEKLSG